MEYLISSIIGYLFGSFPTAFIFLKKVKGLDITQAGSGNVGAMNSYEVTNSKAVGISVFLMDFFKGVASVLIPIFFFSEELIYPSLGLLFAVFSHCFNPWINFKGGRGLATAAGGAAILFPYLLLVWAILWTLLYFIKKDILFANIAATGLSFIILLGTFNFAEKFNYLKPESQSALLLTSVSILIIIFIKHIEPLKELIASKKNNGNSKND